MENMIVQNTLPQHGTPAQVVEVPAVSVTPIQIPPVVLTPEQTFCYMAGSANAVERERKRKNHMMLCGALDALDLCAGWIPGVGQLLDLLTVAVCVSLFGPQGFYVLLEMIDITGVFGAFCPTATLVARSYWKNH